jgi:hypothetical protein
MSLRVADRVVGTLKQEYSSLSSRHWQRCPFGQCVRAILTSTLFCGLVEDTAGLFHRSLASPQRTGLQLHCSHETKADHSAAINLLGDSALKPVDRHCVGSFEEAFSAPRWPPIC